MDPTEGVTERGGVCDAKRAVAIRTTVLSKPPSNPNLQVAFHIGAKGDYMVKSRTFGAYLPPSEMPLKVEMQFYTFIDCSVFTRTSILLHLQPIKYKGISHSKATPDSRT